MMVLLNGGPLDGQRRPVAESALEIIAEVDGQCAPSVKRVPGEGHPLVVVKPARVVVYKRAFGDQFVFKEER